MTSLVESNDKRIAAAARIEKAVGKLVARKHRFPSGLDWEGKEETVREMMETGLWDGATAIHFVALYEVCFEDVYGVSPGLGTKGRRIASFTASRMLASTFDGDPSKFAEYVRWAWTDESRIEKWRREHNKSGKVLTWQRLFSEEHHALYRIDLKRRK